MAVERQAFRGVHATTLVLLLAFALTSCGAPNTGLPAKLALLAPFEGQYREIGYNALYAVRLAFDDAEPQNVQFLAVDDGGTQASAIARVKALNLDPAVLAIIALGPNATDPSAQMANDKPLIMIGNWGQDRADADSLYAANPQTANVRLIGDLHLLNLARELLDDSASKSFVSSGALPDANFRERYLNSAMYAPAPNWLATLTYDIARLALAAWADGNAISATAYAGLNGLIRFEDGYWGDAPLNRYRLESDQLVLVKD